MPIETGLGKKRISKPQLAALLPPMVRARVSILQTGVFLEISCATPVGTVSFNIRTNRQACLR